MRDQCCLTRPAWSPGGHRGHHGDRGQSHRAWPWEQSPTTTRHHLYQGPQLRYTNIITITITIIYIQRVTIKESQLITITPSHNERITIRVVPTGLLSGGWSCCTTLSPSGLTGVGGDLGLARLWLRLQKLSGRDLKKSSEQL